MAELALLIRQHMVCIFAGCLHSIVANSAILGKNTVVYASNFHPVKCIVTAITARACGYVVGRRKRCVHQPIGNMAQLALTWSTGEITSNMTAFTL